MLTFESEKTLRIDLERTGESEQFENLVSDLNDLLENMSEYKRNGLSTMDIANGALDPERLCQYSQLVRQLHRHLGEDAREARQDNAASVAPPAFVGSVDELVEHLGWDLEKDDIPF